MPPPLIRPRALPPTGNIGLQAIYNEYAAPIATQLTALVRGGAYVPDVPSTQSIPTTLPVDLLDFRGTSAPAQIVVVGFGVTGDVAGQVLSQSGLYLTASVTHTQKGPGVQSAYAECVVRVDLQLNSAPFPKLRLRPRQTNPVTPDGYLSHWSANTFGVGPSHPGYASFTADTDAGQPTKFGKNFFVHCPAYTITDEGDAQQAVASCCTANVHSTDPENAGQVLTDAAVVGMIFPLTFSYFQLNRLYANPPDVNLNDAVPWSAGGFSAIFSYDLCFLDPLNFDQVAQRILFDVEVYFYGNCDATALTTVPP